MRAELQYPKANMHYGWADSETTTEIHVFPCTEDGDPLPPHIPSPLCPCGPSRDDFQPGLFIHDHLQ